jgi:uncharacterized protein
MTNIELTFEFRDDNILYAVFKENPVATPIDLATAKDLIETLGFSELYFYGHAFEEIEGRLKLVSIGEVAIAEQQDAKVDVVVSGDFMSVFVTTQPAFGGTVLTPAIVIKAIEDEKVVRKVIKKESIKEIIASKRVIDFKVAKGELPQKGKDSTFTLLIEDENNPDANKTASKTTEYLVVNEGTPLLRRNEPTQGVPGFDVFGNSIPSDSGEVVKFASDMSGIRISDNDENLVIADIKGHPVIRANSVTVDPVLHLKNVSLATGNISFEGSVEITGDVMPNMKIKVTGDVHVKGVVERAHIIAGNDIVINSGLLGEDPNDKRPEFRAYLKAGGSVKVRYVNLSRIEARKNIEIREYCLNCSLRAGDSVLLGQDGGRGQIIGGKTTAGINIDAKVLGNDAYLPTELTVGASDDALEELIKFKETYREQGKKAKAIAVHLKKIKAGEYKGDKDQNFIRKVKEDKKAYLDLRKLMVQTHDEIEWLEHQTTIEEPKHIQANSRSFPNLSLNIGNCNITTKDEKGSAKYEIIDHKISIK